MSNKNKLFKNVVFRILAVFIAGALSLVGAGAFMGVNPWVSMFMAGIQAVSAVLIGLSWAFSRDGDLTLAEVNQVFTNINNNRKTGAERIEAEKNG